MNGRGKIKVKFIEYSASREYFIKPDIVEYDKNTMPKQEFALILGTNTLRELGAVLDFWTNKIIVHEN